jgi:DNA polymerase III delta subunit
MARTHYTEVEYDISEFDDDELIEEMESRNLNFKPEKDDPLVYELFLARVEGNTEQFEKSLQKLFLDRLDKRI